MHSYTTEGRGGERGGQGRGGVWLTGMGVNVDTAGGNAWWLHSAGTAVLCLGYTYAAVLFICSDAV